MMEQSSATASTHLYYNPSQFCTGPHRETLDPDPPVDSAYNSEHENTPEQDAANQLSRRITATLLDEKLWKCFYKTGNEMIVTKPGRRLFPAPMVTLRGLEPTRDYTVTLRVAPADTCRYKFLNMQWSAVGESEINQNEARQLFVHPNSPNTGEFWMKKPISFKSVKITHNPTSRNGNILLHTMHKYVLEIIVGPADGAATTATTMKLDDTAFIAVSAYQNTNLTQLKIDNNPFAKGFRDKFRGTVFHSEMSTYTSGFPSLPFPIMGQQVQSIPLPQTQGQVSSTPSPSISNTISLSMVPALPSFKSAFPSYLAPIYPTNYIFTPTTSNELL